MTVLAKCWENHQALLLRFLQNNPWHITHCHAHSLSLSVKDVTKNTKILRDTMGTAEEIIILIKYSPKQENILGSTKKQTESEDDSDFHANNLLKLSEARWTVRAAYFKRILDNYHVLWNVWKHSPQNEQIKPELNSCIIGSKTQMESFHLFFGLNLGHRSFSHTDNLSKTLQAKKCLHAG